MTTEFISIATDEEVAQLVGRINEIDRLPIIVGTLREGEESPPWDAAGLASRLQGEADLYLATFEAAHKLTKLVGKANSVHSGWVRIYPAGSWRTGDQNRNRVAPEHGRASRVARKVAERILEIGFQGYRPAALPPVGLVADTVVINQSPSDDASALLTGRSKSDPSRFPIIRFSGIYPGMPAHRLYKKGMELRGSRTTGFLPDFFPDKPIDHPRERFAAHVGDIACTWVQVGAVTSDVVSVYVHPEIVLTILGDGEDLTWQYSEGSVVKVVVMRSTEGWDVMPASDDDDAFDAMSALPDGPPWLIPPAVTSADEVDEGEHTLEGIFDDEELIEANREIERLQLEIRKLKNSFRTSRAKKVGVIHQTDEHCLRADMRANYFERFCSVDRDEYPMPEVLLTSEFIAGIPEVCRLVNYDTFLRAVVNIAIDHPQTRCEKFKVGTKYGVEIDGWQFRRGHVADEAHGAPRIRFAKKGSTVKFLAVGHHDDDL
jgi:hypothetical protein